MTIAYSASRDHMEGKPKVYTHGFEHEAATLQKLSSMANQFAIAGAKFSDGHRKSSSIVSGSNLILIDCDEPGQSEAVEAKLKYYTYVKVPSASNLTHDYKWHYFVPTQETLSTFPAAYKWQVEQFFNQIGITASMVDTTGSYDIARQFAPATIGMTVEEATERTFINDGLSAPILTDVPVELNTVAAKSITLKDVGTITKELPANHLWYQSRAISYEAINVAVRDAGANTIVSGFGCPHNNKAHTEDATHGYGFAYKNKDGSITVKCSGNECSDKPYFNVPVVNTKPTFKEEPMSIYPVNPEHYRATMSKHWQDNLHQIKADGLDTNWSLFAATMNNIICGNQNKDQSKAWIIPMATGESKTQGSIVYLSILPTGIKAMMVVRLNEDAISIAEQINALGGDAVAYNSSVELSLEDAATHQSVIVSHEFFKRNGYRNNLKWQTFADDRDLFIIDEALHSVNSVTLSRRELDFLHYTAKSLKQDRSLAIIEDHIKTIDRLKFEPTNGFIQLNSIDQTKPYSKEDIAATCATLTPEQRKLVTRSNVSKRNASTLDNLIDALKKEPMTNAISCRSRYIKQQHLESFYRKADIDLAEGLKVIIGTGAFASRKRESVTGVRELIPGGVSFAVLDATAPINAIYDLQHKHKGDVAVVPVSRTRNYKGFTIKCGRTATGKGSLHKDSISEMCNSILVELVPGDKILFITHKSNKVFISAWLESVTLPADVKISIEHYGNITGKNNWRDYNKVALIGLPHKGTEFYQSLNIVKTEEDLAYQSEGITNHTQIEYTDLAADMVQAAARIRIRNIINKDGGCLPATAYITLNPRKSLYATLEHSLEQQFPGSNIVEWKLPETISKAAQLPLGFDTTLEYLEDRLTIVGADITVYEPRDVLDINRESYRRLLTNKTFIDQITHLGIEIQQRKVMDKRGRMKKNPEKFFARITPDVTDHE